MTMHEMTDCQDEQIIRSKSYQVGMAMHSLRSAVEELQRHAKDAEGLYWIERHERGDIAGAILTLNFLLTRVKS